MLRPLPAQTYPPTPARLYELQHGARQAPLQLREARQVARAGRLGDAEQLLVDRVLDLRVGGGWRGGGWVGGVDGGWMVVRIQRSLDGVLVWSSYGLW